MYLVIAENPFIGTAGSMLIFSLKKRHQLNSKQLRDSHAHKIPQRAETRNACLFAALHDLGISDVVRCDKDD